MIYHFTPYSSQKNFADSINEYCRIVPNSEDWICVTDGDVMFLTYDWGAIIERAVESFGQKYALLGCWTNRLNPQSKQIRNLSQYDNFDIKDHHELADSFAKGANTITEVDFIAGMFMLFQKSTWEKVGGFQDNSKFFDLSFSQSVKNSGLNIGLINQLYVFHLYRIWSNLNPALNSRHLDK